MIVLICDSWIIIWLFIELSSISFIIYIIFSKLKRDWSLSYFLIQSVGSVFLLLSFIFNEINEYKLKVYRRVLLLLCFSVLLKVGIYPFHFWVLKISLTMKFKDLNLLLIIQKIAPLWILSSFFVRILLLISLLGLLISTLSQFRVLRIILLLVYSSISHIRWILVRRKKFFFNTITYFIFYSFILIGLLYYLNKFYIYHFFNRFSYKYYLIFISLIIYSLAGMPLLLGFFPKWLIFFSLSLINKMWVIFIFVLITGINFYIYNRFTYNSFIYVSLIKGHKKSFILASSLFLKNIFFPINLLFI